MAESRRKDGGSFVERDPRLSKVDSVRRSSAKRRMSVENRISEKKIITIGDYHTPLPEGWSYRESTKHKGKWYYISPTGQAQWIPPLVKTERFYEWKLEIFIEFGPGKLGMNLKAVDALPDTLWTQFQVEIHTLRKLGNGHASPAELYNWSVKPDRRIYAGFRIVEISGSSVAGYTYSEVIEKINKTPRPLVIGFCDCHRGLVGDPDEDEFEDDDEDFLKSVYQQRFNTIQSEFMKTLVLTELDKELWNVDMRRLSDLDIIYRAKCKRLKKEMKAMAEIKGQLQDRVDGFVVEKNKYQAQLDKLDMQEHENFASLEEQRAHELSRKHQVLLKAIDETTADNKCLMDEFAIQTIELDRLYSQLDKDESNNVMLMTKTQLYDEYGIKRSPFILEDLNLLYYTLEEATIVEEQELQRGTAEVNQLKKQLQDLKTMTSNHNQTTESSIRDLEMKLDWLRDQLQKTTTSITKAEKKGKTKSIKGGYRRRNMLKIEYQLVQDELQMKLQQMGPQPTCPEEPAILDAKMEFLRQSLREIVKTIAKCPKNQQQLYLDRRAYLKIELDRVMNRCIELGLPMNTIRRSSLGSAPSLSERMSILDSRRSAFAPEDESPPGTPVYYPESITPPYEETLTPPFKPQTPPFEPIQEKSLDIQVETPILAMPTLETIPPMPPLSLDPVVDNLPTYTSSVDIQSNYNREVTPPEPEIIYQPPVQVVSPHVEVPVVEEFTEQLTYALQRLSHQQQESVIRSSDASMRSSVYSLDDSEVGLSDTISICSDDIEGPSKVDQLKADLHQIVAQIALASNQNNQALVVKLKKARNQIKSELALAQDELQIEHLKYELREIVVPITQASKQNDEAAAEAYMKKRVELKAQLKAVNDSYAKTLREAKPLDELKNELRSVVKELQKTNLSKDRIDLLMKQKAELKHIIVNKQPQLVNQMYDVEALKQELRKVVSNITHASKENDTKLVEKLMRKRTELKIALAKAQDVERKSDKYSRESANSSRSSSNGSAKSSDSLGPRQAPNIAQSFAGSQNHGHHQPASLKSQSFGGSKAMMAKPYTNTQQTSSAFPMIPSRAPNDRMNESFMSNDSSFGGSTSSNSLSDSFTMSETKVAQAALHAFREELIKINKLLEKTTNERTLKKLLDQRADIKTRIAITEEQLLQPLPQLNPEWGHKQVKYHIETLQKELREVVKITSEMKDQPSAAYMRRRQELKTAIQTGLNRMAQLQEEEDQITDIHVPVLSPDMSKETLKQHIDILKRELRHVVSTMAQTTSPSAKLKLKSQRSTLKTQLAQAQDQLATIRNQLVQKPEPDEVKMLETYIDSLKTDLKHVVAQITQTQDIPTVHAMHLRRRNDLKKNLRQAQDQLIALQDRQGSNKLSIISSEDDNGIVMDALLTTRMTQVYQNITTKMGYLEWIPQTLKLFRGGKVVWCKLETSGCFVWYKSPSDTKIRGMIDLTQNSNRNVRVSYSGEKLFTFFVTTPGMISNHEELTQFKTTSNEEAKEWVYLLENNIQILLKQFPQGNDELFSRNSLVY